MGYFLLISDYCKWVIVTNTFVLIKKSLYLFVQELEQEQNAQVENLKRVYG